jgi:hypothetical protein
MMGRWASTRSRPRRVWGAVAALAAAIALLVAAKPSRAQIDLAQRVEMLIAGLDFDLARRDLRTLQGITDDPRFAVERARLAIYELDCDGAAAILGRSDAQRTGDGETLADIARGCQRVTASLSTSKDEKRGIEVRWQDENDAPLAPLLFDTVAEARVALTRDLGVDWPLPTRIVVVRDLLSLSAMTGLPYDSARTTGTVAVAKWGRVTLLSPGATPHGFPWRDTIAHELTHLAVTRATRDRAPLWLQEGVAKREEQRWRDPDPFDDRPSSDTIVQHGMDRGMTLPFDKLGPSIAMLPSADAAMVAFAEVTSFVRFYADSEGVGALPKLFRAIREGRDPNAALVVASGADLKTWDARWRASILSRPRAPLPPLFALGDDKTSADALRRLRDRVRLAELLLSRGRADGALKELDRIGADRSATAGRDGPVPDDATVLWLRGRALETDNRAADVGPSVDDVRRAASSFGPWWALRGRWANSTGDSNTARTSFSEALSVDPLDPESACESIDVSRAAVPADGSGPVCDAARARAGPPFESEGD